MAASKDLDYMFVEELPQELTCSICLKVLCEPHLVNCCEQCYCKSCLDKWSEKNKSCPHCRKTEFSIILLMQKSRKIGELKVYCPNKQHGCKVQLKISEYDEHLSTTNDKGCLYVKLDCPKYCKAKVFRGEMKTHAQDECPERFVKCVYCNTRGKHKHIMGSHITKCPSYPLPCPQGCEAEVLRKDLEDHHSTCPLEPVLCPFSGSGCKTMVCRKDIEKHVETTMLQHMTELAKSHTALKESYTAKVNAISQVLKSAPSIQSTHQIYTILADTSNVKLGDSISLALSESNEKSGHHDIVLSQAPPKPNYKFRLEWEMDKTVQEENAVITHANRPKYTFKFLSVVNGDYKTMTAETKFDVAILFDQDSRTVVICCNQPKNEGSLQLIETFTLNYHQSPILILQFNIHDWMSCQCQDQCHHHCKGCGFQCDNTTPEHICERCEDLCARHYCHECYEECCDPYPYHSCQNCGGNCD